MGVQEPWISATPCSKQGPTQLSEVNVFKDAISKVVQEESSTLPGEAVLGDSKHPSHWGKGGVSVKKQQQLQEATLELKTSLQAI